MGTMTQSIEQPLPELPELPVLRETFCTQEIMDEATSFLEENNPGLLLELRAEECSRRTQAFMNVAYEILEYLEEAGADLPETPLGQVDLIFELSRRIRAACNLPGIAPRGRPLAEGPGKPLPPLARTDIDAASKRAGITQDMADRVLQAAYEKRPDIWYGVSEEYRREIRLFATVELRELLRGVIAAEYPAMADPLVVGEFFLEAIRRIYKMCGIDGGEGGGA